MGVLSAGVIKSVRGRGENPPEVSETIKELHMVLSDIDKLVSDPNPGRIGDGSVEAALQPLRDKLGLLQVVLMKLISVLWIDPLQWL